MGVPSDLLYTKEHTWVRIEENLATIGITFYAQSHLGDVTFVNLPEPGDDFRQFDKMIIIESVKTVTDIHSPLSGEVVKINEVLAENPGIVNQSCYDKGWLMVMRIYNIDEKDNLIEPGEYDKILQSISK